jgi:hypothetical protein
MHLRQCTLHDAVLHRDNLFLKSLKSFDGIVTPNCFERVVWDACHPCTAHTSSIPQQPEEQITEESQSLGTKHLSPKLWGKGRDQSTQTHQKSSTMRRRLANIPQILGWWPYRYSLCTRMQVLGTSSWHTRTQCLDMYGLWNSLTSSWVHSSMLLTLLPPK